MAGVNGFSALNGAGRAPIGTPAPKVNVNPNIGARRSPVGGPLPVGPRAPEPIGEGDFNPDRNPGPVGGGRVLASMKKGGPVNKTGLYKLHKGEKVIPKGMNSDIISGMKKPTNKKVKLVKVGEGHKPDGPRGLAAVKALGRTKTTGNFKRIEKAEGKGAAIAAYQNALKAHKGK